MYPGADGDAAVMFSTAATAVAGSPVAPTMGTTRSVPGASLTPERVSANRVGAVAVTGAPAGKYPNASTTMLAGTLVLMHTVPSAAGLTTAKLAIVLPAAKFTSAIGTGCGASHGYTDA